MFVSTFTHRAQHQELVFGNAALEHQNAQLRDQVRRLQQENNAMRTQIENVRNLLNPSPSKKQCMDGPARLLFGGYE